MKEKIKAEINKLTDDETKQLLDSLKGIFKGGVTIVNPEDRFAAMAEHYKYAKSIGY